MPDQHMTFRNDRTAVAVDLGTMPPAADYGVPPFAVAQAAASLDRLPPAVDGTRTVAADVGDAGQARSDSDQARSDSDQARSDFGPGQRRS